MDSLLRRLLEADNVVRNAAEAELTEAFRTTPGVVLPALLDVAAAPAADPSLRTLAATVVRRGMDRADLGMWARADAATRDALRARLLGLLAAEVPAPVRRQVEVCVANLAQRLIPAGQWPDLLDTLLKGCRDPRSAVRCSSLEIFSGVFGALGNTCLKEHVPAVFDVFKTCLEAESVAGDVKACQAAVEAVLNIGCVVDEEAMVARYASLLPQILQLLKQAVTNASLDEFVVDVLDAMILTCEAESSFFFKHQAKEVPGMLEFLLKVAYAPAAPGWDIAEGAKTLATELLVACCETGASKVQKIKGFPQAFFTAAVEQVLSLVDEDEVNAEAEAWANSSYTSTGDDALSSMEMLTALSTVASVAESLGNAALYKRFHEICRSYLASGDWRRIYVVLQALHFAAEGFEDEYTEDLAGVMGLVQSGLQHPHPCVRAGALSCLHEFALLFDDFAEEYHAQVVPTLAQLASSDGCPRIQAYACRVIGTLYSACDDDDGERDEDSARLADPYFEPLLQSLGGIVSEFVAGKRAVFVAEEAVEAVAAVASNVSPALLHPRYPALCESMLQLLAGAESTVAAAAAAAAAAGGSGGDLRKLSAECIACLAQLAEAAGADAFAPLSAPVMAALNAVFARTASADGDDPRVDALLTAYGRIAGCLKAGFLPHLSGVLALVMQRATAAASAAAPGGGLLDADQAVARRNTAVLQEKAQALELLGTFGEAVGPLLPAEHPDAMLSVLLPAVDSAEGAAVRCAAAEAAVKLAALRPAAATAPLLAQLCRALVRPREGEDAPREELLALLRTTSVLAARCPDGTLGARGGAEVAEALVGVWRASSKRETRQLGRDGGSDSDDESSSEEEEDSDDDDDDDTEVQVGEEKLRQHAGNCMETLLVRHPSCREAMYPILAAAFADFVRTDPLLRDVGLDGTQSLAGKGCTVLLMELAQAAAAYAAEELAAAAAAPAEARPVKTLGTAFGTLGCVADALVKHGLHGTPEAGAFAAAAATHASAAVAGFHRRWQEEGEGDVAACVTLACYLLVKLGAVVSDPAARSALLPPVLSVVPVSGASNDSKDEAAFVNETVLAMLQSNSPELKPHAQLATAAVQRMQQEAAGPKKKKKKKKAGKK